MITLLLIRHGIAEAFRPGLDDAERALTKTGWERTRAAMKGLVARGYLPTEGYSSPYRRAGETLVCLKEATTQGFPVGYWEGLVPEGDPARTELWLRELLAEAAPDTCLALVSHQPFLADLVHHLTGRWVDVKRASCTVLHFHAGLFHFATHFAPALLRGDLRDDA